MKAKPTMFSGTTFTSNASQNATSPPYDHVNVITTTVGGGLSIVGVSLIIISYFQLQEIRQSGTAQQILLCISTADYISACVSIFGVWLPKNKEPPSSACVAEGFFIIFAITASFFWTSCLAIHLFLVIVRQNGLVRSRKLLAGFHFVSWGLPLFLALMAFGCQALGPSPSLQAHDSYIKLTTGGWCWIRHFKSHTKTVVWTLMTSKFWELAAYLLIMVLFCTILIYLRLKLNRSVEVGRETMSAARMLERRMLFIPVAFILLRIWGTVRYFAYVSNLEVRHAILKNKVLYALQGLGDSSQGFANSIFFFLSNKRVSYYWKAVLHDLCSFCYKYEDPESNKRSPLLHNSLLQIPDQLPNNEE